MFESNPNSRLEAFCDGVFAIALTLLIIDIRIPATSEIISTEGLWTAIGHIVPSILAFLLSFIIILITWVNHHNAIKLINRTSTPFIYANGLLLLSVVFVPFPTALVGENLLTDHASPAVILYNAVLVLQALGWLAVCHAALRFKLGKSEKAANHIRTNLKFGYFAFVLYSLCAITAIWFPVSIAIVTTASWLIWLIWGINLKVE